MTLGCSTHNSGRSRSAPWIAVATLTALLIAVVPLNPKPASGVAGFGDVDRDRDFAKAVQWMVDKNITAGTSEVCFSPDRPVTRGQAATLLWRMQRKPFAPTHKFTDVTAPWQQSPVSWMADTGITRGTSSTTFSPDELVTKGELATMLHRLAGQPPAPQHRFADVTAPYQQQPVSWLVAASIAAGTSPTAFAPDQEVTRGQVAGFLYRYHGSPAVELDPNSPRCMAAKLTLGFGGDLQLLDYQIPWGMLVKITDILSAPDLMFANLETVVGTRAEVGPPPINKRFNFLSPPEAIDQIVDSGIDVLGMANNHTWDFGPRGAASTSRLINESPLVGTGAGETQQQAYEPVFVEVEGWVIGVVSLTTLPCGWANSPTAERIGVAWACDRFAMHALQAITTAAAAADLTVVMLHSGWELTDCPTTRQRQIVTTWINFGADVVSISHPHQLQGVEVIDGAAVLWSTGNLAFQNGGFRRSRSAVFEVTIGESIEQIRLIPVVLPGGVAAPADPRTAKLVFNEVSARTVGGRINAEGVLVPDPAPSICDY